MRQIILNRLDHLRIKKSLRDAKNKRSISPEEAMMLENELSSAVIVEPNEIPHDIVTMNSILQVRFLGDNRMLEFQIVYPENANLRENKISIFSPVATALIGYRENDEIEWIVPGGWTKIRIEKIIFQPEASGNYLL